jgi:type I restriction enzyme, S subunit
VSWPLVKLETASEFIRNGASIKQSNDAAGLPITRIETIADRTVNLDKCGYADVSESEYLKYRLRNGDILISHINSEKHLAKCAIFESDRGDIVHGMNLLCLRPSSEVVFSKYLFHYLSSPVFLRLIPAITKKSVNQASFTVTAFKDLEIPLPPLPEQKRIAAILDKADAIRRKRQKAIQLADDFLRAVFLDMFGDPVTNTKGWGLRRLSEVCRQITVGVVVKPASYYVENGVPAIRSLNIKDYDIKRENFVFFSSEDNETTLSKSRVYEGDLVIVRSGQPGKAAVITKELGGVNAIDVLIARPDPSHLHSDYLAYFFNSGAAKSIVLAEGRGQIQQHLNVGSLNAAEIPIPPLELQREFAEILERVKAKYLCSDETPFGDIFNSLSQRAFSGQL